MKRTESIIALLIAQAVVLFYHGTLFADDLSVKESVRAGTAVNAFAFDLYKQMQNTKGNLVFSPFSLVAALSMTCEGARGSTQVQMQDVLHMGSDVFIQSGVADIDRLLRTEAGKKQFELHVANALWMEKRYTFLKNFLDFADRYYDASLEQVDFRHSSPQAVKTINQWVESKTDGKIRELIDSKAVNTSTRLVLTSAIYFKGVWKNLFNRQNTNKSPFYLSEKEPLNVPVMYQKGKFKYLATNTFQVLELPNAGNDLSMLVILPRKISGLPELESGLNAGLVSSFKTGLKKKEVSVFLPKFRFETPLTLSRPLSELGMKDAFTTQADFSGMDGTRSLLIEKVFHTAIVEVNEQGTEASAGTAIVMKPGALPDEAPLLFKVDHPFLFLIKHEASGTILFMGRVVNPAAKMQSLEQAKI